MTDHLKQIRKLLPAYTVAVSRGGRIEFRFQIPAKYRPHGWKATYRLPLEAELRSGRADPAELAAVIADAQRLYERFESARKLGENVEPDAQPKGSLAWIAKVYREDEFGDFGYRSLRPSTREDYKPYINHILRWADEIKQKAGLREHPSVSKMRYQHIRPFLLRFADRPRTQERVAQMLDTFFQIAVAEGIIDVNPMKETKKLKRRGGRKKKTVFDVLWSPSDERAFFSEALRQGRKGVFIICAFMRWQAHRQIDGARLQRSWFEGDPLSSQWMAFEVSKTGARVRVPNTAEFRAELRRAFADGVIPLNHLALNDDNGQPYIDKNGKVSRAFNTHVSAILEKAGLAGKRVSHLRHTAIIEMARAGLSVHQIRSRTAHSIKTVVAILEHYLPPDEALALEATLQLQAWRAEQNESSEV